MTTLDPVHRRVTRAARATLPAAGYNNCTDSTCTIGCTNQEQSCKLQCDGQYGGK